MGWHNKPNFYECLDCGNEFKYLIDTIYMAAHGPICCTSCKSHNYRKVDKPITEKDLSFDFFDEN